MLKSHSEINTLVSTWRSRTISLLEAEERRYKNHEISFEAPNHQTVNVSFETYITEVKTYFNSLQSAVDDYFSLDVNSLVNNIFTSLKMAEYRVGQRYEKGKMRDCLNRSNAPRGASHLDEIMYNFSEFNIGNDDIYHNLVFRYVAHETESTSNNGSSTKQIYYTRDLINSPIIDNMVTKLPSEKSREKTAFDTLHEWCYRGDDNFFDITQNCKLGRLIHVPDEKEIAYNLYRNGIKNFKSRGVTVYECERAVEYFTPTNDQPIDISDIVVLPKEQCIIKMDKDTIETGNGTIIMVIDSLSKKRVFADSTSENLFLNLKYDLRNKNVVNYLVNSSQEESLKVQDDQLKLFTEGRVQTS